MEDEDCLPENSPLKIYLQNNGFTDFEVIKNENPTFNCLNYENYKSKVDTEYIDSDVIHQLGILISTRLLFEEDISNVEKLLSNFKIVKNGMFKSMFQGVFGVAIVFFGLCLYWILGGYAFFIVSSFYAYRAADYLTRRHFIHSRLKKLATILQSNFFLLKKTVKFIEENNRFSDLSTLDNKHIGNEFKDGFDFFNNFKTEFYISLNDMILIFIESTKKLINKFPVYDFSENFQYYLCDNFNKSFYESVELPKLYEVYLLAQSEFLQRLMLSLIQCVKSSEKNNFKEVNRIVTETCINLLKIKNNLNKKFKYIFLNGIHNPTSKVEFKLPAKNKLAHNVYAEELVSNIHDTSNTFQNLLIKSRILEESLNFEKIPPSIEEELVKMQNDLNSCQKNLADSFVLLKRANNVTEKKEVKKVLEEELKNSDEKLDKIVLGFPDLDPQVEDDIFEVYLTDDKLNTDLSNIDDWDFEDRLKKKLEKEYSNNVIRELKVKLCEKAKNREKREIELLMKKGLITESEILEKNEESLQDSAGDCDRESEITTPKGLQCEANTKNNTEVSFKNCSEGDITKNNCEKETQLTIGESMINKKILLEKLSEENKNNRAEESESMYLGNINKKFLSDISEARGKILSISNPVEEFYCDSSEEEQ